MKLAALCLVGLFANSVAAYPGDLDFYKEVFRVYKDELHPRLVERLPSHENEIISQLELVLIENPRLVTLAATSNNDKKIYISVGFLDGLFNYAECLLLEGQYNVGSLCNNYFEYYLLHIKANANNPPWPVTQMLFRNNEELLEKWSSDPTADSAVKVLLLSGLIVVVFHECGHHIMGFPDQNSSVSDIRKIEQDVDRWAFSTLHGMGEEPALGAAISLGYFSQIERYRRILRDQFSNDLEFSEVTRTHPRTRDRAKWAFAHTCGNALGNPVLEKACDWVGRAIDRYE